MCVFAGRALKEKQDMHAILSYEDGTINSAVES